MKQSRRKYLKTITTTSLIGITLAGCFEPAKPKIETKSQGNSAEFSDISIEVIDSDSDSLPYHELVSISLSYMHADETSWETHITYGSKTISYKNADKGTEGISLMTKLKNEQSDDGMYLLTMSPQNEDYPTAKYYFTIE